MPHIQGVYMDILIVGMFLITLLLINHKPSFNLLVLLCFSIYGVIRKSFNITLLILVLIIVLIRYRNINKGK